MDFKIGTYGYIALKDLKASKDNIISNPNNSAFLSQQSVEKILKHYIKEVIEPKDKDIFNSHNLNRLASIINIEELNSRYRDIKMLRDIYYDTRYPGEDYWDVDKYAAKELYECSKEIVDIVIVKLNENLRLKNITSNTTDVIERLKKELENS